MKFIKAHKEEKGHSIWHRNLKKEEQHGIQWKPKGNVWFRKNDDNDLSNYNLMRVRVNKSRVLRWVNKEDTSDWKKLPHEIKEKKEDAS